MTYAELLRTTADQKEKALRQLNDGIRNPQLGFLVKEDIKQNAGSIAYYMLAKGFCQAIAENLDDLLASVDKYDGDDIVRIYMAYYDDDPDLYQMLPTEAKLFDL